MYRKVGRPSYREIHKKKGGDVNVDIQERKSRWDGVDSSRIQARINSQSLELLWEGLGGKNGKKKERPALGRS